MDCSLPDSSVHGILQARILEWVAISFSKVFSYSYSHFTSKNTEAQRDHVDHPAPELGGTGAGPELRSARLQDLPGFSHWATERRQKGVLASSPEGTGTCGQPELLHGLALLPRNLQRKPVSWSSHVEAGLARSGNVFTGSKAHTAPTALSLGVNVLYDFCSPGKY